MFENKGVGNASSLKKFNKLAKVRKSIDVLGRKE